MQGILAPLDRPAAATAARLGRVLVALDLAEPSHRAAEWVARHFAPDGELVLAHAVDVPSPPSFLGESLPAHEQLVENARRGAEMRLRELAASLGRTGVRWEVRVGDPVARIIALAGEVGAELIVVGAHGAHTGLSAWLGSTAQRVARVADVPVIVARALPPGAPRRLLVALDETPPPDDVLAWSALLARRFAAEVELLHVVNPLLSGAVTIAAAEPERARAIEQLRAAALAWLARQAARLETEGVTATTTVAFGDPPSEILAAARRGGGALVVMGRGGGGRIGRALVGSTTDRVLHRGRGPVLIVPADAD